MLLHASGQAYIDDLRNKNFMLECAVLQEQFDLARILLSHHADIETVDSTGVSLLQKTVRANKKRAVEFLLEAGAGVNKPDNAGKTALHEAVQGNFIELGEILLSHGADMNLKMRHDVHGECAPLHWAILNGRTECVKMLLQSPSSMSLSQDDIKKALLFAIHNSRASIPMILQSQLFKTKGLEVVHQVELLDDAIMHNDYDMFYKLLYDACDASCLDKLSHKNEAFVHAVVQQQFDVARVLLEHGAQIDVVVPTGNTLLCHSLLEGNIEAVKFLIQSGADVNAHDTSGRSLLHIAAERNLIAIGRILLDRGADVAATILGHQNNLIPLFTAISNQNVEFVNVLLDHLSVRNISRRDIFKALALACRIGNLSIVRRLMDFNIYTHVSPYESSGYEDPLNVAIDCNKIDIFGEFIERGVEFDHNTLSKAIRSRNFDMVKMLIMYGADVSRRDSNGQLPTDIATSSNISNYLRHDVPYMLLALKASSSGDLAGLRRCMMQRVDLNVRNKQWNTPLALAVINGHKDVVQELLCCGADPSLVNKEGKNPLQLALEYNRPDIVALFRHAATPMKLVTRRLMRNHVGDIMRCMKLFDRKIMAYEQKKQKLLHMSNKITVGMRIITSIVSGLCAYEGVGDRDIPCICASSFVGLGIYVGMRIAAPVIQRGCYLLLKHACVSDDKTELVRDERSILEKYRRLSRVSSDRSDIKWGTARLKYAYEHGFNDSSVLETPQAREKLLYMRSIARI